MMGMADKLTKAHVKETWSCACRFYTRCYAPVTAARGAAALFGCASSPDARLAVQ
jgi:hypothetical protein